MLDLWSYKAGLKDQANEIAKELQNPGAKLAIHAAIGSGRHSIAQRLSELTSSAILQLPPFGDLDTPLHALVQLANRAGLLDEISLATQDDGRSLTNRAAQELAKANCAVIVLMPVPPEGSPHEADAMIRARIERWLAELLKVAPLRLAVLATPDTRLRGEYTRSLRLEQPMIGAQQILMDGLPDELAQAARVVRGWMEKHDWASTPIEARLQVGLVALGERPDTLGHRLPLLVQRLIKQLRRLPSLEAAVRRLALARRALPEEQIQAVSGVEPRWLPLLSTCIGYGDIEIRVPEVTRHMLLRALRASAEAIEEAHGALAQHHEHLDGSRSLKGLSELQAINWMEKVHHLALGGEECASKWREQDPAGREQLWARARHLSRDLHRHKEAAQIYSSCIERFGEDAYSRHYLAYNLERGRDELPKIRQGYEYAVTSEPENPWWQQRWIRFLIAFGTLDEARTAWQRAIRAVDPDGTKMRRSSWLALNLHYWVARRWLAFGYLTEAREVVSEISEQWLENEAELRELLLILVTHEQSLALGDSVYPPRTPLEARWRTPRGLRPTRGGKALQRWAPGRVIEADRDSVTVVLAPTPEEAQQVTFEAAEWSAFSGGEPAEDAAGYFELGTYEDGTRVVKAVPDDGEGPEMASEDAELLTWLRTFSRAP